MNNTKNYDEDKIKYEPIQSNDKEIAINLKDKKTDINLKHNKLTIIENNLFYNGYEYYKYKNFYIKKEFRNKNSICYKYKNYRKDSIHRKGMGKFYYAEIIVFLNEENKIENINPNIFKLIKIIHMNVTNYII